MIIQELTIAQDMSGSSAVFQAVQGESGARELRMDLIDAQGAPINTTRATAYLYIEKPSRNVCLLKCDTAVNGRQNQVACKLPLQAAVCAGRCKMFLIVYLAGGGEARFSNMVLNVEPSSVDDLTDEPELGPLAAMLGKSGELEVLLANASYNTEQLAAVLADILNKYGDGFSQAASGSLNTYTGSEAVYKAAMDIDGNMLLVESQGWNGQGSAFSTDHGKTWKATACNQNSDGTIFMGCELVFGGKKFLVLYKQYAVWGKVSGGSISWEAPTSWFRTGQNARADYGKYLNGKYFVCCNEQANFVTSPIGRNLCYCDESGVWKEVRLPNDRMVASCITYDVNNQRYLVAGHNASSLNSEDIGNHYDWILASTDLKSWTSVFSSQGTDYLFKDILVQNGRVVAVPRGSGGRKGFMRLFVGDADTILTTPPTEARFQYSHKNAEFFPSACVEGIFGMVIASPEAVFYSADGSSFKEMPAPFSSNASVVYAASSGRRALISAENLYAVFLLGLEGENLGQNLLDAASDYNQAKTQMDELLSDSNQKLAAAQGKIDDAQTAITEKKQELSSLITLSAKDLTPGQAMPGNALLYAVYSGQ